MLSPLGRNAQLAGLLTEIAEVSLHDSDPGLTGEREITGDPYTRRAPLFDQPRDGSAAARRMVFDVPPKTTVRHIGYWNREGDWLGSRPVEPAERFDNGGMFIIESLVERVP